MAYCPSCGQKVQIIVTKSEPHCSNCFKNIEYPTAQSADEYRKFDNERFNKSLELKISSLEWHIPQLRVAATPPLRDNARENNPIVGSVCMAIALVIFILAHEPKTDGTLESYFGALGNLLLWGLCIIFGLIGFGFLIASFEPSSNYTEALNKAKGARKMVETEEAELEKLKSTPFKK